MEWIEVKVEVNREALDAVSELLMRHGAQGVAIIDSLDYQQHEEKFGEIMPEIVVDELVTISAYYPESIPIKEKIVEIEHEIVRISEFGLEIGDFSVHLDALAEENWANSWKQYFLPTRVSRYLTIVPSWTDYQPFMNDEKAIILDPGMAFGTGTHPTTVLSMQALESKLRGGENLIDVGTGSGVLSVAASILGATQILATDIDDVAVKVAKENIALNPVDNIKVQASDLLKQIDFEADIIVANILADILVDLMADAYRLLKNQGYLILSGIIQDKLPLVEKSYLENGFVLEARSQMGEWVCLILKKTDSDLSEVVGG
ncbi:MULTISPECIES: 50S ribosomal protein L11 methyltransferase [unclassified Enterococcus]|uniref:50S ribosomal protein L11 methyltransferase n=1 Tax=unclassified Enterococcus TaxID=2608891 RepID=UPI001556B007|nr:MULTISPECIES: 50S ribosomal protein L11 methyltransferase [unclassified Enterococcus]MBS7578197.1 50S ribosomal protein L11 methyltransferase [Enterococcus sp. MMGLQ5-2]MBS7585427.1 50S ribosomal protein L11 methyltransferase [Enterococcus sp. MMGLQ5-1]NPD13284.1 50S ribosomal protein L11 methyltransferase [Enterococcus sp. MMGLQ5-1]NPD38028.1 50S ribosomal protein L11 methyltransferase [Enterococcus sp. MMGLQ5-2]